MRQRNDTLGMMSNPLVGQMFDPAAMDMNEEVMMEREAQKEHELRILGTMLFQAFFLSMCILLYERWEWSQFNNTWEALVFWFTASFALQAGFYFVYRAGFEDTNNHQKDFAECDSQQATSRTHQVPTKRTTRDSTSTAIGHV